MARLSPRAALVAYVLRDLALGVLLWLLLTTTVGEARMVPTGSMEPTIRVGDRVWTDKLTLHFQSIRRGDIVVFDPPFQSEFQYVKRVVGLPGETVRVLGGKVWVNGRALTEPYVAEVPDYQYGPVTIPAGDYLVLGDNRNDSSDSHDWGLLPGNLITARAVYRFWPLDRLGPLR